MDGVAAELRHEFAVHQMSGLRIRAVPLQQDVVKHAKLPLMVLLVAVAFVLLIACGNVANLLLARAVSRKREMAVRSALGATGYRLARQVLIESLVVSLLGGVAGIFVAELGVRLLIALHPASLPRLDEIAVNGWALAYTAGLSLCTALLFGLAPAIQAARPDLRDALADGTRSSQRLTKSKLASGLILGQVALSVVLMIGSSLLLRSFARLQHIRPGFEPENVLTFRVSLPAAVYPDQNAFRTTFRRLREQLRSTPGVLSVGETVKIPLTGSGPQTPYAWNDETLHRWESISADWRSVSPDYFSAMGIRFEAGRAFSDDDDEQHPGVVIIDDLLAKRVWPDEDPIGKRLTIDDKAAPHDWLTVVGVVHHVRAHDITTNLREQIYLPYFQQPTRIMVFTLKTAGDPATLIPSVTQAVHSVDPNLAVYQVHTMQEYFRLAMAQARFVLILSGVFGGVALLLTAIGIYGLISYFTSKRVREFGIRVALGAQRADIYRMVISEGFKLAATGVVIGLAFAFFTGGMLRSLLYGVSANDAVSFFSVPLILLGVALLATFLPARQAMQVDAATALRSE